MPFVNIILIFVVYLVIAASASLVDEFVIYYPLQWTIRHYIFSNEVMDICFIVIRTLLHCDNIFVLVRYEIGIQKGLPPMSYDEQKLDIIFLNLVFALTGRGLHRRLHVHQSSDTFALHLFEYNAYLRCAQLAGG